MDNTEKACAKCHKAPTDKSLKRCAKCQNQWYCSRECQKLDWKSHKAFCSSSQQTNAQTKPHQATTNFDTMPQIASDFFKNICQDNYLHQFPTEADVYRQLIDCYRMRLEDDYNFSGDTRGLYNGDDPLSDFQEFLDLAETRNGVLPGWWSDAKRGECVRSAIGTDEWSDLNAAVEKGDVMEHYGDSLMPMKLRLLAEEIYGTRIRGT